MSFITDLLARFSPQQSLASPAPASPYITLNPPVPVQPPPLERDDSTAAELPHDGREPLFFPGTSKRLLEADFIEAAASLGCSVAAVHAFAEVESRGAGFLPDGRPTVLFEAARFGKYTSYAYLTAKCTNGTPLCQKAWTPGTYGPGGAAQWVRISQAADLGLPDPGEYAHTHLAAMKSASYGMFQIMGDEFAACGFRDVVSFVRAMCADEHAQLQAFVAFCKGRHIDQALRSKDFRFASLHYNGAGQVDAYSAKLEAAYRRWGGR